MKTKLTDVFFDLDHTLWDFDKNSELTFNTIFKNNHPEVDAKLFIDKYVPINQECWKLYQFDKITHEELRYNRLKHSFDAIDYSISDAQINKISDEYIKLLPDNNHLFDGTFEILEYLKPKYNLHIITNGFADVQSRKMYNAKIESYFQTVTNSEMAGVKKPNPGIFNYAIAQANANIASSIMIGDSYDADVLGALNVGLDAIYFNESNANVDQSIKQINNLLELKKFL
ncbi:MULTISPECIES: YjjG family noncanonical pyrimidine nucleotidase [unclassified Flavobacterium]|uniref:YjjG family noncanonical pyrimidine nucleotidase n=1 Tax=unclassified Flavobacterium TaxID=196869 RepID=UPI00131A767F|nr:MULTISPECIES: YjjG family noncanonical pyrimidine nucleotidase [unclassified Flavobacterium]